MPEVDPPFDDDDQQSGWGLFWVLSALAGGLLWIALDIFASARSVFYTASYVGAYYFPRLPYLIGGLVGLFGAHMGMPQDGGIVQSGSLYWILGIFAVYAALWHTGRSLGAWRLLRPWQMLVNLNLCLLTFYYVWPMRPTW